MTHIPSPSTLRVSYFLLQPSSHDAIELLRGALEANLVRTSALQKVWSRALKP